MRVATGQIRRLIVTMPPRHGKSSTVSHYFPAWYLGTFPEKRVILTSYEADFAAGWGRKVRDVLGRQGRRFGVRLREDSAAANRWDLHSGGGMVTAGVGGAIVGRPADLLLLDDPIKNAEQAFSPTYREKTEEWFLSTAFTRLEPGASVIVVLTRWHDDDIAGRLLRKGGWELLKLPALAREGDPLGRQPGEALWPSRYDVAALEEIHKAVGDNWWESLYQQEPFPEGGNLFKPDRMSWYEDLGDGYRLQNGTIWPYGHCHRFAVVDPSVGRKTDADPTAMGVFAQTPDDFLLTLDMVSERIPIPQLVPRLDGLCRKWGAEYAAVESNGFQIQVVREIRDKTRLVIREVHPHGKSKLVRAFPAIIRMEAGAIAVPRLDMPWKGDFIGELARWTGDERELDNQVDVLAYAVREMVQGKNIFPDKAVEPAPRQPRAAHEESRLEPTHDVESRWRARRLFGYGRS
jgi:predicted phage terminase large subunit-like protein